MPVLSLQAPCGLFPSALALVSCENKLGPSFLSVCLASPFLVSCLRSYFPHPLQVSVLNSLLGISLVVQWLRIRLPMQGKWVRVRVREDPTCHGATKPVRHNYWACPLEPTCLEPVLRYKRSHRSEKPAHRNEEQPPLVASRESPCAATKTQRSQR